VVVFQARFAWTWTTSRSRTACFSEYLIWRVEKKALDWYALAAGNYEPLRSSREGILKSQVFLGLWLDSAALINGDLRRVQEVLQRGLNSPEHAEFVARLQAAGK